MLHFKILFIINKHRYGFFALYAAFMFLLLLCVAIKYYKREDQSMDRVKWKPQIVEDLCHSSRKNDYLELLYSNTTFPPNSIFFHDTSCRGGLSARQACVVESTAKANPERQVNVFFSTSVNENVINNGSLSILTENYNNVKFLRVLIQDYVAGTPVESKVMAMDSDRLNVHIAKILKYLTIYKYGGIYLSLDVIVARKFDLWDDWVVKNSPMTFSSDMFGFSKSNIGRQLADAAMGLLSAELSLKKKHNFWSYSKPSVISKLAADWCSVKKVEEMTFSTCNGLAVYPPEVFYPISFYDRKAYFNIADFDSWKKKDIFTYFIWDHFTRNIIVTPMSLFGKIAKEYCPLMFDHYTDEFGVWYPWHEDM